MSDKVLVLFRDEDRLGPYQRALSAAAIDAEYCTPSRDLEMERFRGLVLTGGTDVDPALYGQTRAPETDAPDNERDRSELRLLEQAAKRDLPVFAICRGLQILNVFFGGTLQQHLPETAGHRCRPADKGQPVHSVSIEPDSLLAAGCECRTLDVNSRHHQAVDRLGSGLRVTAKAPDGVIEAIEPVDKLVVLAVQWHPEDQVFRYSEQLRLFTRFGALLNSHSRAHDK